MPGPGQALRARMGLTARAWAFLASGVLLALIGIAAKVAPLVQFGTLVALLPAAAAVLTRGPGPGMKFSRTLSARELTVGEPLDVTVDVRGRFPRGRSLLLEDLADESLGGPHRLAISGLAGQAVSRPHYRVRVGSRGVHHLGPILIHVVDRFGMIHRVVSVAGREEVLVTPRLFPLEPGVLGGGSLGSGSGHLGPLGAATDDVIPRAYQAGDEVRRIDWKASARTGDLMVRSEENPWRSTVTVLVDTRADAHRGREPHSSLDVVLSLAASIGALALDCGWDLTVLTLDDTPLFSGSPMSGISAERKALLRALATVPASRVSMPNPTLQHSVDQAGAGPVVAIVGALTPATARVLAGVGVHSRVRMLVSTRVDQWAAPGTGASPAAAAEEQAAWQHLRGFGWRTSALERDTPVPAAWTGLVAPR
jgi:uncharacterized protein (DUF58 family)